MNRWKHCFLIILFLSFNLFSQSSLDQNTSSNLSIKAVTFSSKSWCEDQMTIPFSNTTKTRPYLSGVRMIFEPQLGVVIQPGLNKVAVQQLHDIPKFAAETNIWQGWLSIQAGIIYPSTINFEDDSDILPYLKTGTVDINYGLSFGVTLLDGIIALGYGVIYFDRSDFSNNYDGRLTGNYWFFNVQPASLVRFGVKNTHSQ